RPQGHERVLHHRPLEGQDRAARRAERAPVGHVLHRIRGGLAAAFFCLDTAPAQIYCITTVIHVDPAAAVPLWKQIEEGIRGAVASGDLRPGDPVPSVRDLARDLRINPATVARAYQQLREEGLLAVRRGEGTFVSSRPPVVPRGERIKTLRDAADRYAAIGRT